MLRVDAVKPLGRLAVAGQGVVGERIGAEPRTVDQQLAVDVDERAGRVVVAHAVVPHALAPAAAPKAIKPFWRRTMPYQGMPRLLRQSSPCETLKPTPLMSRFALQASGIWKWTFANLSAVKPGDLGHQIIPVVVGPEIVLLRRPAAVVAGQSRGR